MFKPLAIYIGLRYTRAKQHNYFVSFISLCSMLGIALGVMVLITVLSVMNGFDEEIHKRIFGMVPEITITNWKNKISDWRSLTDELTRLPAVLAAAPFVGGQALLTYDGQAVPIILTGIDPVKEQSISHLSDKLIIGKMMDLQNFGIILGRNIAEAMGVTIGDKVTVMLPQVTVTLAGMVPRFKQFKVIGVFSAGTGFNFDSKLVFIHIQDAQKLFQFGSKVTGIKLKLDDIYKAPELASQIALQLGEAYQIGDWTQQFGEFFKAVQLEKKMMFLILLLIIAVATFNLVSSLVMVVNDKQDEIAILRTLGATPTTILYIFIVQGLMVGLIGTILGLVGGILIASNATAIVNHLQIFFDVHILSSSIYFVDYLPSKILGSDLILICLIALGMSFIATIYPAWRASRIIIAEALRYE